MVTQIEQMLVEAWKKFCDYYDTKAPQYRKSWPFELKGKDAKDSCWICWNEYDLTFHIGRFFYDIIRKKKEEYSNIEIHFEKKVNSNNFKGYTFEGVLDKFKKELQRKGVSGEPKVDMIVACEDSNDSFLLCAEAKCFHGAQYRNPIKMITDDITKLKALKENNITKKAVFVLFDDYYYCRKGKKTAKKIKEKLDEIEKNENGITVLFHTSEAKLENY